MLIIQLKLGVVGFVATVRSLLKQLGEHGDVLMGHILVGTESRVLEPLYQGI
jgi:hypothetical protein